MLLLSMVFFGGCASNPKTKEPSISAKDPWESVNRPIFVFNDKLDGWVLKPVAKGYQYVTPDPMERGVSNFFHNLAEVPSALNHVLQWKWKRAGSNTGRFLLNSTIGLGGLFDVAKYTGLTRMEKETFGQTLSYWGVGAGPYLVLPFWGPSTVTDLLGSPVDWYADPLFDVNDVNLRRSLYVVGVIDRRADLLEAEELISGDRYTFIREAFLQRREFLVKDGNVVDDFGGDFDDFDEDF